MPHTPLRPIRKSSEAPEVVGNQSEKYFCRYGDIGERLKRGGAWNASLYQKELDPNWVETRGYPSPVTPSVPPLPPLTSHPPLPPLPPLPRLPRNIVPEFVEKNDERRTCGLLITMVLILVAFLIGGGIGGGVGGALVAKEKSRNARPTCVATSTTTATRPAPSGTGIVDDAGCPLTSDVKFNSTTTPGKIFHQLCYINTLPPAGQTIDIGNQTVHTWTGCLNACADFPGCVAATWVMFSTSKPETNSMCFFKNSTGLQTSTTDGDRMASAYLVS